MWSTITKPSVGTPTKKQTFADAVIDNLTFIYGQLASFFSSRDICPNGSFEADEDSDSIPDSWTRTNYTGGSFSIDYTSVMHGGAAIKFVHPGGAGNGGGYIVSDFFEVTSGLPVYLSWWHKCSVAGMRDKVELLWYQKDMSTPCSTASTECYNSTSNPASWARQLGIGAAPADCCYAKIRITGGDPATTTGGNSYWDCVRVISLGDLVCIEYLTAGSYNFRTRADCCAALVIAQGGGGGGGGQDAGNGGGGGGGGSFSIGAVALAPSTSYAIVVGAAGSAGGTGADGGNGGATTWASTVISAGGGSKGIKGGAGGAGGTATGGAVNLSGVTGTAGTGGGDGGPGGDSAPGSQGGAGATASTAAGAGYVGGGGGGGRSGTYVSGAAGGAGFLKLYLATGSF